MSIGQSPNRAKFCGDLTRSVRDICNQKFVLGLAMIDIYTKFEVSVFTHYKDMKGDEKCRNWGGLEAKGHSMSLAT